MHLWHNGTPLISYHLFIGVNLPYPRTGQAHSCHPYCSITMGSWLAPWWKGCIFLLFKRTTSPLWLTFVLLGFILLPCSSRTVCVWMDCHAWDWTGVCWPLWLHAAAILAFVLCMCACSFSADWNWKILLLVACLHEPFSRFDNCELWKQLFLHLFCACVHALSPLIGIDSNKKR